ncbi:DUF397 domain-containing protein [Streptomyces sp. NPDC048603]|uniref:DUF397 domain-containing protein n=1 Tax=Streptomyces sp. NPDC048603 TaxID=3365577 RepID=UPI0037184BA8
MNTAQTAPAASELVWRKSTYSGAEGGDCVEVATSCSIVHIRDSKQLGGPVLTMDPTAWAGLVALASEPQA